MKSGTKKKKKLVESSEGPSESSEESGEESEGSESKKTNNNRKSTNKKELLSYIFTSFKPNSVIPTEEYSRFFGYIRKLGNEDPQAEEIQKQDPKLLIFWLEREYKLAEKIKELELTVKTLQTELYTKRSKENINDLQAFFAEVQFKDPREGKSFDVAAKLPNDFEKMSKRLGKVLGYTIKTSEPHPNEGFEELWKRFYFKPLFKYIFGEAEIQFEMFLPLDPGKDLNWAPKDRPDAVYITKFAKSLNALVINNETSSAIKSNESPVVIIQCKAARSGSWKKHEELKKKGPDPQNGGSTTYRNHSETEYETHLYSIIAWYWLHKRVPDDAHIWGIACTAGTISIFHYTSPKELFLPTAKITFSKDGHEKGNLKSIVDELKRIKTEADTYSKSIAR